MKKDTKKELSRSSSSADGFEAQLSPSGAAAHLLEDLAVKGPGLDLEDRGLERWRSPSREPPLPPMDKDSTVDVKLMMHALDEAHQRDSGGTALRLTRKCSLLLEADREAKKKPDVKPARKGKAKKEPPSPSVRPARRPNRS